MHVRMWFLHLICFISYRPKDWYPRIYEPVFDTYSQAGLVFHIELMNGMCNFQQKFSHYQLYNINALKNGP